MNNETHPCLTWSTEDIDLSLETMDYANELTKEQKQELLDRFFKYEGSAIMECINQKLVDFLSEEL
jgi:hypothetical protein